MKRLTEEMVALAQQEVKKKKPTGINVDRIYGEKAFGEIPEMIISRINGVERKEVVLLLDTIIYHMKDVIMTKHTFTINSFGRFHLEIRITKPFVSFSRSESLKAIINGRKELDFTPNRYGTMGGMVPFFTSIAKCFGFMDYKIVAFVFNILIFGIVRAVKKYDSCFVRNFGTFFLKDGKWKDRVIPGLNHKCKNPKIMRFKPVRTFKKEVCRTEEGMG